MTVQAEADQAPDFPQLSPGYPDPIDDRALIGVSGDFVRLVAQHTEANREALLFQFLTASGALMGRNVYRVADGARHGVNTFVVVVGDTATARKGTA